MRSIGKFEFYGDSYGWMVWHPQVAVALHPGWPWQRPHVSRYEGGCVFDCGKLYVGVGRAAEGE